MQVENNITLYIKKNYLSLDALSHSAQCATEEIMLLIDYQCIPGFSFTLHESIVVYSAMNDDSHIYKTLYFNPSVIKYITACKALLKSHSISAVAHQIKRQFDQDFDQLFQGLLTPGIRSRESAWQYWVNGVWGICLQEISIASMAKKELSRLAIKELTDSFSKTKLLQHEKQLLQKAIDDYNDVVVPEFVPYMQASCSRTTEVSYARQKYL